MSADLRDGPPGHHLESVKRTLRFKRRPIQARHEYPARPTPRYGDRTFSLASEISPRGCRPTSSTSKLGRPTRRPSVGRTRFAATLLDDPIVSHSLKSGRPLVGDASPNQTTSALAALPPHPQRLGPAICEYRVPGHRTLDPTPARAVAVQEEGPYGPQRAARALPDYRREYRPVISSCTSHRAFTLPSPLMPRLNSE